jgi:raffinose/stachyose/melibiose transport system substrate-binding protein
MRTVEQLIEHYAGAELHNKMNGFEESYNNEAVVKALTKYKEFCDKGYFPANFVTQDPDDRIPFYTGQTAMNIEGQWFDGLLLQEEQDINKYGSFPFPSGETSRLSAFCDMTQFNANLTSDELAAAVKFIDFTFNDDAVERFSQFYSFPLPRIGAAMPQGQPNVPVTLAASNANGTFTITDQAFPTEVADELFRVQDGIALNQVTPAEGAARIQAAIESYVAKN